MDTAKPKLKICHTIFSAPWARLAGGGHMVVHDIARVMVHMGHEVHVIYSCLPEEPYRNEAAYPYHVHTVPYWEVAGWNFNMLNVPLKLNRLLKTHRFDMVFGHSVESCFLPNVCGRHRVPFCYIFHAIWMPEPQKGLWRRLVDTIRYWDYHLLNRAIRKARDINMFSEYARGMICLSLGEGVAQQATVRRPGISDSWFQVKRRPDPGFRIIYWGRLESVKGVDVLISGFAGAAAQLQDATLTIIGDGSDKDRLEALVAEHGLSDRVAFLGRLDWQGIQEEAARAHLAVFPTNMESFGLVIAEAMVMGLPVAAAASGSVPELIEHDQTGVLFALGDADAVTALLLDFQQRPEYYEGMAHRAGEQAEVTYRWERFVGELLADVLPPTTEKN